MLYLKSEVYEFISQQTNDPIVEWKTCSFSGSKFAIFQSDVNFLDKISPTFNGKKYQIPLPTLCPEERSRRRLTWRNERNLYHRKCDYSGKQITSMYHPDRSYIVYDQNIWWSDVWDACSYGESIDWKKSTVEQFDVLMKKVPHSSLNVGNNQENSMYTNYSVDNKNTYLSFGPTQNDTCMYGKFINTCVQCYDCASIYDCQWCYEGYESRKCYSCQYFTNCADCIDCTMIEYCQNCKDCIACFGLVHKQFFYKNTYIGKDAYDKLKKQLVSLDYVVVKTLEQIFNEIKREHVHPQYNTPLSENSEGDMLVNCKNCSFCFNLVEQENCKYNRYGKKGINSYDCVFTDPNGMHYSYEANSSLSSHCMSVFFVHDCSRAYWCVECHGCQDIIACVGLRNKQYCIFNKQYNKEEYEILASNLIGKMQKEKIWGEFFPAVISPYAYNETVAQEYYPLNKNAILNRNLVYQDELSIINIPSNASIINAKNLPQKIVDIDDSLLQKVIICSLSGRPYRIMREELLFYRKFGISLPKIHPDERYIHRINRKPSKTLHLRTCDKCKKQILSIYNHNSGLGVYCQSCYWNEVV